MAATCCAVHFIRWINMLLEQDFDNIREVPTVEHIQNKRQASLVAIVCIRVLLVA